VLVRVLRSDAAWALPRPSATDSARFAKRTVSHSHTAMPQVNPNGTGVPPESSGPPRNGSAIAIAVVSTAPTQTRNMTGLRQSAAGLSLRTAPGSARMSCVALNAREGAGFGDGLTVPATGVMVGVDMCQTSPSARGPSVRMGK
jgi:hypothetical protein